MEGTLVVSGAKNREELGRFLESCGCRGVTLAASGAEARRLLGEREFALVAVAAPLPDEFGGELALHAVSATDSGVLLLAGGGRAQEVAEGLREYGVAVLPTPLSRQAAAQAVELLLAARRRTLRLREENRLLSRRLEDARLVCRAKCLLIQYGGMTEEEAHHAVERRAMDRRRSRREAAEEIIAAYEGEAVK